MTAPRRKRRIKRDEAREQIHSAAVALLRTHPFRELSLDLVMSHTDVARTAFYRYYDDMGSLVVQVLEDVGRDLYAIVGDWAHDGETDLATATRLGLTRIVAFFEANGPLVQGVVDAASVDERVEKAYDAFLDTYDRLIVRGFDGMVRRGELAPCDTRALARALNLMGERYMLDSFGRAPFADAETVIATMELIWMRVLGDTKAD